MSFLINVGDKPREFKPSELLELLDALKPELVYFLSVEDIFIDFNDVFGLPDGTLGAEIRADDLRLAMRSVIENGGGDHVHFFLMGKESWPLCVELTAQDLYAYDEGLCVADGWQESYDTFEDFVADTPLAVPAGSLVISPCYQEGVVS